MSTRHIAAPRGHGRLARGLAPVVEAALAREVAVSHHLADRVGTTPDAVLLNGVRAVPPAPEGEREPVVLVAQRLAGEKDTATAVRAWAASGLAARGWRLEVAGDGPEAPALRALAAELGVVGSVHLLGWVDDAAAAYRRASVLLAPAPAEPCGLTVLEAMAHALPVVAAGSGGHTETVGTHPGAALFAPGDAQGAAAHLVRLADDPAGAADYGRGLRELQLLSFSLPGHVDRLESEYAAALAARRGLRRRR